METLQSIELQIRVLQAKAAEFRKIVDADHAEELRSCLWLKDVTLIYQEGISCGIGIAYKFGFSSNNSLLKKVIGFDGFCLFGDTTKNYQAITLRSGEDYGYYLSTDSAETMCNFLDKFKPKIRKCEFFDRKFRFYQEIRKCMSSDL